MSERFVAIASEQISKTVRPGIWVRGGVVAEGQKILAIFCDDQNARGGSRIRLYPLDPTPSKAPPSFRISLSTPPAGSHVVACDGGVTVYIDIASRRRRVEYQLSQLRPSSCGDLLEALIDLDHLIFHRALNDSTFALSVEKEYERMTKLKLHALGTPFPEERHTALTMALKLARQIAEV